MKNLKTIFFVLLILGAPLSLNAAVITWSGIQDDTGNASDVVSTGTLHDAATVYTTDVTLNGVTFKQKGTSTSGILSFVGSNITFSNVASTTYFGTNYGTVIPSSWDSEYKKLLEAGAWRLGGININLNNLVIGDEYLVQLWTPYWNRNYTTGYTAGNFSGFLNMGCNNNNDPCGDSVGQYVTGTFIADSSTQSISASSPSYSITSSVQVRNVTETVPVPAPLALMGLGLAAIGFTRKRKG